MRRRKCAIVTRKDVEQSIPDYVDSQLGSIERFQNALDDTETEQQRQEPQSLPTVYYTNEAVPSPIQVSHRSKSPPATPGADPRFPLLNKVASLNSTVENNSTPEQQYVLVRKENKSRPSSCPVIYTPRHTQPIVSQRPTTHHGAQYTATFTNNTFSATHFEGGEELPLPVTENGGSLFTEDSISFPSPPAIPLISVPSSPVVTPSTSPVFSHPHSSPSNIPRDDPETSKSSPTAMLLSLPSPPTSPLEPGSNINLPESSRCIASDNNQPEQPQLDLQDDSVSIVAESNQVEDNSPEEYVVIEMPEHAVPHSGIPRYVQAFFIYLYYTGQSCYIQNGHANWNPTRLGRIMYTGQKALFWIFTILGIYYSYCFSKNNLFLFVGYRQFDDFVRCGFYGCCFIIQLYFAHLVAFRQHEITSMLQQWEDYELHTGGGNGVGVCWNATFFIVIIYGILSQILSLSKSIWRMGIIGWSYEGMMLYYSKEFVQGFLYKTTKEDIESAVSEITVTYGTSLTISNHFLGWIGFLASMCYNLRTDAARDLFIFVAITNKDQVLEHIWRAKEQLLLRQMLPPEQTVERDLQSWSIYRILLDVVGNTNDVLGGLLNLLHVYNLVTLSFVLEQLLDDDSDPIVQASMGTNLAKALVVYIVARYTASMNSPCQEWIEGLPCKLKHFMAGNVLVTKLSMLAELVRRPLGLGSPLIDDNFLFNAMGLVLSLFGVLVGISLSLKSGPMGDTAQTGFGNASEPNEPHF